MTPKLDGAKTFVVNGILGGMYPLGTVLPSVEALANAADCSVSTIQAALADLAQSGVVKRVRNRGTIVQMVPSGPRICLLMSVDHDTNILLQQHVYDTLILRGFTVEVILCSLAMQMSENHMRRMEALGKQCACLISLPWDWHDHQLDMILKLFRRRIHYYWGDPAPSGLDHVVIPDASRMARDVVQHLLGLGHRRIGICAGGRRDEYLWVRNIANIAQQLIEMAGAEYVPHFLFEDDIAAFAMRIRDEKITAYWALNDHCAHMMINACARIGIKVPEDLSIIGRWDTSWSINSVPPIDTISIVPKKIAEALVDAISPSLATRTVVEPQLIVRGSSARAARAAGVNGVVGAAQTGPQLLQLRSNLL
jgi:DNA-binding LacI/PurR family transcriptional regulator